MPRAWAAPDGAARVAQGAPDTKAAVETVVLRQPRPGEVKIIPARPGQRLIVAFDPASVRTIVDGPNLGLLFPDGGWIILSGLGPLVGQPGAPVFVLKGGIEYSSAQVYKNARRARQTQPNLYAIEPDGGGYSAGKDAGPPPVPRAPSLSSPKAAPGAPAQVAREAPSAPKMAAPPRATPSPPELAESAAESTKVPRATQPDSAKAPAPSPAQGLNRGLSIPGATGRDIGGAREAPTAATASEAKAKAKREIEARAAAEARAKAEMEARARIEAEARASREVLKEAAPAPGEDMAEGMDVAPEPEESRPGVAALTAIAPGAGNEPVYNVRVDDKLRAKPLVLAHDRATKVRFDIGPRVAESVVPAIEAGPELERLAAGRPLELSVTLDCLVCTEATYFRGTITYDPETRRSDEAVFPIRPSRAAVARSHGYGLLILTVDHNGLDLAVIKIPAFVDAVAPAIAANLAVPPPVTFARQDVEADVIPDLVIDIGGGAGKLPIGLNPINPDLKAAMVAAARGRDIATPFESGVTTADLTDLVAKLYKALRAIVEQNETTIQAIYAARGQDTRLSPGAARLRFPDADRDRALGTLRRPGADLYRRIFMDGAPALRRAMRALYRYSETAGRPLRIRVRATDIYAPWQMLYGAPNRRPVRAEGFWGFRYQIATLQKINEAHGAQGVRTFLPAPRPDEILFGSWRGNDDVGARAGEMHERLAELIGGRPLWARSRGEFLNLLDRHSRSVKLVMFYGHATSGTVMLPGEAAIASALSAQPTLATDWTGERLLFADDDLLVPSDIQDLVPYETYDDEINPVFFKNRPIVVLNACETGTGGTEPMNNNGFIGRFSLAGASAVFVTEAPIWRNFAYHFGNDLVREITTGRPMQAALFEARWRHLKLSGNPLGLLYSLYGNPALRIETAPGRPPG